MGIADRDYAKVPDRDRFDGGGAPTGRRGPSGFGLRLRGLSMTTWLIIITSAIFIIDRTIGVRHMALAPTGDTLVLDPSVANQEGLMPRTEGAVVQGQPVPIVDAKGNPTGEVAITSAVRRTDGTYHPFRQDAFYLTFPIQRWLQFTTAQALIYPSKTWGLVGFEFWCFFGYQFLHADIMHLAFNMFGLYMFGPIVEERLRRKRFLAFYLLCGLFGALLYMLLNAGGILLKTYAPGTWIPPFLPYSPFMPLIGASACVYGIILAAAYLAPKEIVDLFGIIPMKLRTLAYILLGMAVFAIVFRGSNAGGEAAHLGGALAGAWLIRHPHQLHGVFDLLGRADPWSSSRKARSEKKGRMLDRAELDRILAKISKEGMGSLTARERELLRSESER